MAGRPADIPVDDLLKDTSTQMRAEMNQETVNDYAAIYVDGTERNPDALPRPMVYRDPNDKTKIWLTDGWHRAKAAKKAGIETLKCDVVVGNHRDAMLAACRANATHGLPRTNADKRKALGTYVDLLKGKKRPSHDKIAAAVGVSQAFVTKFIAELEGRRKPPKAVTGEPRSPKSKNGSERVRVIHVETTPEPEPKRARVIHVETKPAEETERPDRVHLAAMQSGFRQIKEAFDALADKHGSFNAALGNVDGLRSLCEEIDLFVCENIRPGVTTAKTPDEVDEILTKMLNA